MMLTGKPLKPDPGEEEEVNPVCFRWQSMLAHPQSSFRPAIVNVPAVTVMSVWLTCHNDSSHQTGRRSPRGVLDAECRHAPADDFPPQLYHSSGCVLLFIHSHCVCVCLCVGVFCRVTSTAALRSLCVNICVCWRDSQETQGHPQLLL